MHRLAWPFALLLLASAAACGGGYSAGGDDDDDSGGGGVGFGGAQDIGQFRNILDAGGIPGPATLDANGFFREHAVELPASECGQPLCAHAMLSVGSDWLDDGYQAVLEIVMTTDVDASQLERPPLDLIVVLDTSGSMDADDRIGFARDGLHLLIDNVRDGDRLGLVRYSAGVEVLAEPGDGREPAQLHALVDELTAGGSTNLHDGLQTGFQIAEAARLEGRGSRVILLSDGLATAGITGDDAIMRMADDYVASGIGLTTIGVGLDFNVELMRGLADRGAGNFYFIEEAMALPDVFVEEIDFFTTPLAHDLTLEVEGGPAYTLGEVIGTTHWQTAGNRGSVFIPSLYVASRDADDPGEPGRRGGASALFLDMLATGGAADTGQIARMTMSYRLPDTGEWVEQDVVVTNPSAAGDAPADRYYSDDVLPEHVAMYNIFRGLRSAAAAAETNYDCSLAVLEDLDADIGAWLTDFIDPDIENDRVLVQQFIGNLRAQWARSEAELGYDPCAGYDPGDDYDDYDDYGGDDYYACSAAGGGGRGAAGAVALVALAAFAATRRRLRSAARG